MLLVVIATTILNGQNLKPQTMQCAVFCNFQSVYVAGF